MDKSSLAGIGIAIGGILLGLILEGGKITQVVQPTAAMIVFGGTLGAVLLQFPLRTVIEACRRLGHVFLTPKDENLKLIQTLVNFANKARRSGVVSLDSDLKSIEEPFLR